MNRRLLIATIFLASFVAFAIMPNPTRVQAVAPSCASPKTLTGGPGATVTFIPIMPGNYYWSISFTQVNPPQAAYVVAHDNFAGPGPWPSVSLPWTTSNAWTPGTTFVTFTFQTPSSWSITYCGMIPIFPGNGVPLPFMDGRCNQQADQTVAVYPDNKGGYQFYAIYQGVGYFAFRVTEQNLDDNPTKSENYLMAHNLNVWLYRLTDGSLLVTGIKPDGKLYSFNIGSCGAMED